jgi:hypothetical protein
LNLIQLRTEVLAHGFDPTQYSARINQYLNDAQNEVARRVDYYVDEATQNITTVQGTSLYAFPGDLGRLRSLYNVDLAEELQYVGLRDMDQANQTVQSNPRFYTVSGQFIRLYPVPEGAHNLQLRYWKMPTQMVNDTDVPSIPNDYHSMLWVYATGVCYEGDDDAQMAQYWSQRWEKAVARFATDQKFPSSDGPTQVRGMWDQDAGLSSSGWSLYLDA